MTEISRLKSSPAAILVVLGLFYFGVAAFFTFLFVRLAVTGYFTVYLVGFLLVWVFSARMFWTWCGLVVSGFALDFRGLYAVDGQLAYISPRIRSVPLAELAAARPIRIEAGPLSHRLVEFELKRGGRWRIPGILLREPVEVVAQRVRALLA